MTRGRTISANIVRRQFGRCFLTSCQIENGSGFDRGRCSDRRGDVDGSDSIEWISKIKRTIDNEIQNSIHFSSHFIVAFSWLFIVLDICRPFLSANLFNPDHNHHVTWCSLNDENRRKIDVFFFSSCLCFNFDTNVSISILRQTTWKMIDVMSFSNFSLKTNDWTRFYTFQHAFLFELSLEKLFFLPFID